MKLTGKEIQYEITLTFSTNEVRDLLDILQSSDADRINKNFANEFEDLLVNTTGIRI